MSIWVRELHGTTGAALPGRWAARFRHLSEPFRAVAMQFSRVYGPKTWVFEGVRVSRRPFKTFHGLQMTCHVLLQVIMLVLLSLLTAISGASVGPEPVVIIMWLGATQIGSRKSSKRTSHRCFWMIFDDFRRFSTFFPRIFMGSYGFSWVSALKTLRRPCGSQALGALRRPRAAAAGALEAGAACGRAGGRRRRPGGLLRPAAGERLLRAGGESRSHRKSQVGTRGIDSYDILIIYN